MIGLILAAGGSGSRFGSDTPKQFIPFQRKRLYLHSLKRFSSVFSQAVVVVPRAWRQTVEEEIASLPGAERIAVIAGGAERQDSVYEGVCRLADSVKTVLVHDAARPFVSSGLIQRVIEATLRYGACIPALPVRETVKEVAGELVVQTLDRRRLQLVQTPQGFSMPLLREAFRQAQADRFYGTDESMLVERLGRPVRVVPGEIANIKITYSEDLG